MDPNGKIPVQHNTELYRGNKYKIKSVLISIFVLFTLLVSIVIVSYSLNSPILQLGGQLLLELTRIAFIILVTPVAIMTLFVGHRIDDARNKTTLYPIWVELVGLIIGFFLGWAISIEWYFLLAISLGTIWADPFLYAPFPIFTPMFTYLCFKGVQFIYARRHKELHTESFRLPLLFLLFSLPVLLFSLLALFSLFREEQSQSSVTLTNFREIPKGNSYIFSADITVPEDNLYHITASVGSSPHTTSALALRLNGVANIDGLYNFELTKGINKLTYSPNPADCPFAHNTISTISLTFTISKVLDGRFAVPKPNVINEQITCGK